MKYGGHLQSVYAAVSLIFEGTDFTRFSFSRGETFQVRVWRLRQKIRQQQRPEEALPRPHQRQALLLQSARLRQVLHAPELAAEAHESALQVPAAPLHQRHLHLLHEPPRGRPLAQPRAAQEPLHEPLPSGQQPQRVVRVPGQRGAQPPPHPLQRRANVRFGRWGLFQKLRPKDAALMARLAHWLSPPSPSWPINVCRSTLALVLGIWISNFPCSVIKRS